MIDDATTVRRKAMANAIRDKLDELLSRQSWDGATVPDELAEAADKAAEAHERKGNA